MEFFIIQNEIVLNKLVWVCGLECVAGAIRIRLSQLLNILKLKLKLRLSLAILMILNTSATGHGIVTFRVLNNFILKKH